MSAYVAERFTYDDLNRLTTVDLIDTATQGEDETLSLTYYDDGNIYTKSDVGTYYYNDAPHSVSDITGTRGASYDYDDNGNMTDRDGDTITWTPFGKPASIDFGSDHSDFTYGPYRNRVTQVAKTGSTYVSTTYISGLMEIVDDGSVTEYRHNIVANGRTVAILTRPSSGSVTTEYLLRDHQDNVVGLVNSAGTVTESYNFDAFGKRRNSDWTADPNDYRFDDSHGIERGYTGHEHLDNVRLIHMNGRVQDPIIGRFISADPIVQAPFNGQGWNRYSYTWNNPVTFVDPSGYKASDDEEDSVKCRSCDNSGQRGTDGTIHICGGWGMLHPVFSYGGRGPRADSRGGQNATLASAMRERKRKPPGDSTMPSLPIGNPNISQTDKVIGEGSAGTDRTLISAAAIGGAQVEYAAAETLSEKLTRFRIAAATTASIMAILDLLHEADLIDQDIPNPAEILPRPGYAAITLYGGGQGLTLAYGISSTASGLGPAGLALILSGGSGIAVGRGLDVGSEVVFGTSISEVLSRAICAADLECL